MRSALLGVFLGLLLGAAAIWLRETLDTRVRSGEEAEAELAMPVLARIRQGQADDRGYATSLAMLADPGGVNAETFRILRNNLSFGISGHDAATVLVTSSTQGEGKSTTVSNLAVAAALSGQDVVLVDLDLRRPRLAHLFEAPDSAGVTGVALGTSDLESALVDVALPAVAGADHAGRLRVLPAGALPPDPSEFVGTGAVARLLEEVRESSELVLLDAPPMLAVSDTATLFRYADIAFLCVRIGLVRKPMLRELRNALSRLETPVVGIALTGVSAADAAYGGYYGYSYVAEKR